jgi:hypothetical protein
MDTGAERLISTAQERYGWTDATLLGVLTDYIARQDSNETLADYLAERGPEEPGDEEAPGDSHAGPAGDSPQGTREPAYIPIEVRVPAGLRHDPGVAAEIALAAQEYANETYGRGELP